MDTFLHPNMLVNLEHLFTSVATVQSSTATYDSIRAESLSWSDKTGHAGLPCALAPDKGSEIKRSDGTIVVSDHKLAFPACYPDITEDDRVKVAGKVYDILLVKHDSQGLGTNLLLEKVTL